MKPQTAIGLETDNKPRNLNVKALILMVVICSSWGLNHPLTKMAYVDISPVLAAALRSFLAPIGLLIYCFINRVPLKMGPGGQFHAAMLGIIFGIEFVFFYAGINLTMASRGAVLLYTQPFFTALLAHLFLPGDRLNWRRSLGLVLAFTGVAAVIGHASDPAHHSLLGDSFCLAAGFLWAVTMIYIRFFMVSRATAVQTLVYQLLYSFPVLLAASVVFEPVRFDLTLQLVGVLLYQGIGVACISYLIYINLLYRYQASTLAAFTFIAPLTGVIFSGLILMEPMTLWLWIGLALVSGGLWLVNRH